MEIILVLFVVLIVGAMFGLIIGGTVFWVLMLIDTTRRHDWPDENEQLIWIIVQVVAGFIGSIAYYIAIYHSRGKAVS